MTRSPLVLAALASAAVPGLSPIETMAPDIPGTDYDVAVVTDDRNRRWIVRAPRGPVATALDVEGALLPLLSKRLPVAVPQPRGSVALPSGGAAMVYPYLPGRPLDAGRLRPGSRLAAHLGRALAALHDIPPDALDACGLPAYTAEEYRTRRLSEVDRAAGTGQVPAGLLARWERALEQVAHWHFMPTLVHGDLTGEHILVEGSDGDATVSGLLDWDDACVADPADDLAFLTVDTADEALDTVLEAYAMERAESPDRHLIDRARLAAELALARWLVGGVDADDAAVVDQASKALRDLAARVAPVAPPED